MPQIPLFHPFLPDALKNPYPFYNRLREEDPLHWSALECWMVFGNEDIHTFLNHDRFSLEPIFTEVDEEAMPFEAACNRWYRLINPVQKSYFRKRLDHLLTEATLQKYASLWRDEAERLAAALPEWGISDLMARFIKPLVLGVVADLLGVPETMRFRFRSILTELDGRLFELAGMGGRISSKNLIFGDLLRMYLELVSAKQLRSNSGEEDALTALLASPEQGDPVAEEDLVDMLVFLLHTLTENSAHGLGNAIIPLAAYAQENQLDTQNPETVRTAFEECLRFDSPVQFFPLMAHEDVMLHGKAVHRGQSVWLCLGAAHRDPAYVKDPDHFNPERRLEQTLALDLLPIIDKDLLRVIAHQAIPIILPRLKNANLVSEGVSWQTGSSLARGPRTLPVRWSEQP